MKPWIVPLGVWWQLNNQGHFLSWCDCHETSDAVSLSDRKVSNTRVPLTPFNNRLQIGVRISWRKRHPPVWNLTTLIWNSQCWVSRRRQAARSVGSAFVSRTPLLGVERSRDEGQWHIHSKFCTSLLKVAVWHAEVAAPSSSSLVSS